jgi:hypothetical protein
MTETIDVPPEINWDDRVILKPGKQREIIRAYVHMFETKKDAAERLGVQPCRLWYFENRDKSLPLEVFLGMIELTGHDFEEVVERETTMEESKGSYLRREWRDNPEKQEEIRSRAAGMGGEVTRRRHIENPEEMGRKMREAFTAKHGEDCFRRFGELGWEKLVDEHGLEKARELNTGRLESSLKKTYGDNYGHVTILYRELKKAGISNEPIRREIKKNAKYLAEQDLEAISLLHKIIIERPTLDSLIKNKREELSAIANHLPITLSESVVPGDLSAFMLGFSGLEGDSFAYDVGSVEWPIARMIANRTVEFSDLESNLTDLDKETLFGMVELSMLGEHINYIERFGNGGEAEIKKLKKMRELSGGMILACPGFREEVIYPAQRGYYSFGNGKVHPSGNGNVSVLYQTRRSTAGELYVLIPGFVVSKEYKNKDGQSSIRVWPLNKKDQNGITGFFSLVPLLEKYGWKNSDITGEKLKKLKKDMKVADKRLEDVPLEALFRPPRFLEISTN